MKNLEEVKDIMSWGDKRVYVLMAITRQKENEDVTANTRNIHHNVVREEAEFEESIEHLRKVCSNTDEKYRLYVSVNSRDCVDAVFRLKDKIDEVIEMKLHGNESSLKFFKKIDSEFRSTLQLEECRASRKFLFDLDGTSDNEAEKVAEEFREVTDVELVRETPNGHHIITKPFHYTQEFPGIDIDKKTDGMLYLGKI